MPQVGALARQEPYHCQTADEVRALARRFYRKPSTPLVARPKITKPVEVQEPRKVIPLLNEETAPSCRKITSLFLEQPRDRVLSQVSQKHFVSIGEIIGDCRLRTIANARHEAMWKLWFELKLPILEIGTFLGNKDHKTVRCGIKSHAGRAGMPSL